MFLKTAAINGYQNCAMNYPFVHSWPVLLGTALLTYAFKVVL